ncbi:MAG: hypothetical protein OEW08_01240 [Gammaproteobacteria bacterium]|nr:hypothetical protein [Gammaproteobacteria bacterium]
MFEHTSRYFQISTSSYKSKDGREIAYKRRRFLPQGEKIPLMVELRLGSGERLDLITAKTLGDPQQYWRIADANNAMQPENLTAEADASLRVPVPQP